jgi:hypothetical protein
MSDIKPRELRWYRWGNEPAGKASIWTVDKNRAVIHQKRFMDVKDALEKKLVYECPYP